MGGSQRVRRSRSGVIDIDAGSHTAASSTLDREDTPGVGHALELVVTAIDERDARSGHEVNHGSRYKNFVGSCDRADPLRDVNGETSQVAAS